MIAASASVGTMAPANGRAVRSMGCTKVSRASGAAVVACVLLGTPTLAPPSMAQQQQFIVTTRIVMATNKAEHRDANEGEVVRFPYSSYRLLQQERRLVGMEKMEEFPVPGGRTLLVQPTGFKNGRVSLSMMLMRGGKALVNTEVKLRNRGEFVVAGPQYEDGMLFLAIGAHVPEVPGARGGRTFSDDSMMAAEIPGLLPAMGSK